MGIDVLYRNKNSPNFRDDIPGVGGCRNGLSYCEDCMVTSVEKIYNAHYTLCRKPWNCIATGAPEGAFPMMDSNSVNIDHCVELVKNWHDVRTDLENELYALTNDDTILEGSVGLYRREIFGGHCGGQSDGNYIKISGNPETFRKIHHLYN